jgi:hypothetical protein
MHALAGRVCADDARTWLWVAAHAHELGGGIHFVTPRVLVGEVTTARGPLPLGVRRQALAFRFAKCGGLIPVNAVDGMAALAADLVGAPEVAFRNRGRAAFDRGDAGGVVIGRDLERVES